MATISESVRIVKKLCSFGDWGWRVGKISSIKMVPGFPPTTVILYRPINFGTDNWGNPTEIDIVSVPKLPEEIYESLIKEINKKLLQQSRRVPFSYITK